MVWAIDLDDGTLIKALGENIGRDEARLFTPKYFSECGNPPPRDDL